MGSGTEPRPAKDQPEHAVPPGNPWARGAGLGFQFAATIVVFAWLGSLADGRLGTGPWLLVAGVLLGFLGGTIALVRAVPPGRPARPRSIKPSESPKPPRPPASPEPPEPAP